MRKLEGLNQLVKNERYLVIREGKEYKRTYRPVKLGVSSGGYPTTGLKRFLVLDSSDEKLLIKTTDEVYWISG